MSKLSTTCHNLRNCGRMFNHIPMVVLHYMPQTYCTKSIYPVWEKCLGRGTFVKWENQLKPILIFSAWFPGCPDSSQNPKRSAAGFTSVSSGLFCFHFIYSSPALPCLALKMHISWDFWKMTFSPSSILKYMLSCCFNYLLSLSSIF